MRNLDIGYHAGDLGKAEGFFSITCGGRDTGHFGTGTYFVGDEHALDCGGYRERPREIVDFSKYNLYCPGSVFAKYAFEYLKNLNEFILDLEHPIQDTLTVFQMQGKAEDLVYEYESYMESDPEKAAECAKELEDIYNLAFGEQTVERRKENNPGRTWYAYEDLLKDLKRDWKGSFQQRTIDRIYWFRSAASDAALYFNVPKEKVPGILKDVYERTKALMENRFSPSALMADGPSTMFMKALGYEGVDVRFTPGMDNTAYGSVIYDLKGPDAERQQFLREQSKRKPSFAVTVSLAEQKHENSISEKHPVKVHDTERNV